MRPNVWLQSLPANQTTLSDWLKANQFTPSVAGWGADAHAIYTNNYDLGFGRDMYMKIGTCDSGYSASPASQFGAQTYSAQTSALLESLVGHCDVAAVVVNYVGVQAAAGHLNQIVAVAMEYSAFPAAQGSQRFVKFYVFAPDQRSGALQRVTSVDLDHRGEKYVPQACVVCHGGTPAPAGTATAMSYPSTSPSNIPGDVSAGFLPWDLSSFWFSDTDPGFSQKSQDAPLKAQYTQANQVNALKLLNAGAYLTMADPNRFALTRELLQGWYGAQPGTPGLPGAFDATFVPQGWQSAQDGNPANSATLYQDVFAHNCRMCHTMQVPKAGYNLAAGGAQGSGSQSNSCTAQGAPNTLGITAQDPMGCYWQFVNTIDLSQLLSDGRMPFARRTADRLWVDPAGNPGGGTVSAVGTELVAQIANVSPPGTPNLHMQPFPMFAVRTTSDVDSWEALALITKVSPNYTSNAAAFLVQPSWQVCVDPGSHQCSDATTQQHLPVVGANTTSASFQILSPGNFVAELDSANQSPLYQQLLVPDKAPPTIDVTKLPPANELSQRGTFTLNVADAVSGGNGPLTWYVSGLSANLTNSSSTCTTASPCSIASGPTVTETAANATAASYTIAVTDAVHPSVTAEKTVTVTANVVAEANAGYVTANRGVQTVLNPASQLPLDLSEGNTANANETIQVQIMCGNSATWGSSCSPDTPSNSGVAFSGTLTLSGTQLQFNLMPGFATHPPGGEATTTTSNTLTLTWTPLQVQYQVQKVFTPTQVVVSTATGTLNLQVRARVYWYNQTNDIVLNVFQRTTTYPSQSTLKCAGCHYTGTTYTYAGNGHPIVS